MDKGQKYYRIEWKSIKHRVLGENKIPVAVWIDSLDECVAILNCQRDVDCFRQIIEETEQRQPELMEWLRRKPLKALEVYEDWSLLLDCVQWLQNHPESGIYLRQITIPGINTKFFEKHRKLLGDLFDICLDDDVVYGEYKGVAGFCKRYGFLDKPARIRFRLLDPKLQIRDCGDSRDITLTNSDFCRLDLQPQKIFVTENEINFLSFPELAGAMVIFGSGYGFDMLTNAQWLHDSELYYWGDIDSHGFAILDQFRSHFSKAQSFLMDEQTLLENKQFWTSEKTQANRSLQHLNKEERALYNDLITNRFGEKVRLEQEFINFQIVLARLLEIFDENIGG